MVQGEKFRPQKLEGVVDDMLQIFLKNILEIGKSELDIVKQTTLSDLVDFSSSLEEVADKYYDNIEEDLLDENEQSYEKIIQEVSQVSIRDFAEEFLIRKSRRVTIELFANKMSESEKNYQLMKNFSLTQKEYSIVSLDELVKRKSL